MMIRFFTFVRVHYSSARVAARGSWRALSCVATLAFLSAAASPQIGQDVGAADQLSPRLAEFLLLDAEIAGINRRLTVANVALCRERIRATGLSIVTASEFAGDNREALIALAGPHPIVTGVADLPISGELRFGDVIVAVNGVAPVPMIARGFATTHAIYALIDAHAGDGTVQIDVLRDGAAAHALLRTTPACVPRSQLRSSGLFNASTDGRWIEVSSAVAAFVTSPDEMAALIGHELAHVIRRDRTPHDGKRASPAQRERLADRLGIHLAARAGYNPVTAAAIFRRFGKRQGPLHWLDPTHPGFTERAAAVEAEAVAIERYSGPGPMPIPAELLR
jgi:hypothetical protein